MTAKQERFIAEYLVDLNATQAAIRAGYRPKTAAVVACENLRKPNIQAAIAARQAQHLAAVDLTAVRVLEELRRVALSDVRGFFDRGGNLKPVADLTPEQAAVLASVEVIAKNVVAGDGHVDTIHKIRFWDKVKALELLAKHFGLLVDRVELVDLTCPGIFGPAEA